MKNKVQNLFRNKLIYGKKAKFCESFIVKKYLSTIKDLFRLHLFSTGK